MIKNAFSDIKDFLSRIKRRDFSGHTGTAVRNSVYQFWINLSSKVGSLLFTIILARILMPELFGLYSLTIAIITVFFVFSDLGLDRTLNRHISREMGKNNPKKAKTYFNYLLKIKIILTIIIIVIFLISSKLIADFYGQRELILALIFGAIYLLVLGVFAMLKSAFEATNNFKMIAYQEAIFQFLRITIIPIILIIILKKGFSNTFVLSSLILGLCLLSMFSVLFCYLNLKKLSFLEKKEIPIKTEEASKLKNFIISISATVVIGAFFLNINSIILGYFVDPEFLAYYSISFSIINSIILFISFPQVFLPLFSRVRGRNLVTLYKKALTTTFLISIFAFLFCFTLSPFVIKVAFGPQYLPSINILRILSFLLIITPVVNVSVSYLTALGKPQIISRIFSLSFLIHLLLGLFLIFKLQSYGQIFVVYAISLSMIITNFLSMFYLLKYGIKLKKKDNTIKK